jgi:hypothetical protein
LWHPRLPTFPLLTSNTLKKYYYQLIVLFDQKIYEILYFQFNQIVPKKSFLLFT